MTINGLPTHHAYPESVNPLLTAVRGEAITGSDDVAPVIADRLASAARAVRDAAALDLAAPTDVTVTAHGCTAVLDTEGVLGWARLADPRPIWVTYPGSAYLRLDATIAGVAWQLHNGIPAPTAVVPSPRPRRGATA